MAASSQRGRDAQYMSAVLVGQPLRVPYRWQIYFAEMTS